jgi:integrase
MRRGRGEGSIRRRSPVLFEARFVGADGKRHSLYAKSRPEVVGKLSSAIRDLSLGVFVTGERQTVATYLDSWLVDAARSRRPRTMQRYRQLVASHAVPAIGAVELRKLTPQHLAGLYADLSARQAPSSIAQLHAVLHGALQQAVRWNLIVRNPADAVRGPKVERAVIHPLTADQVRTLMAAVAGDPLEPLYLLAVTTGMRSGELLGLTWADVDLDMARLQVRRTLYRLRGEWRFGEPKTSAGRRAIALTEAATMALHAHRLRQAEQLLAVQVRIGPDSLVFADRWGNPLNGFHLTERCWKPLLRRIGLPVIRFHDLRHTCATLMLANGVNPKVVAEMLGHASVTTTLNVYAHVLPTMQEDAARRLDRLIGGAR